MDGGTGEGEGDGIEFIVCSDGRGGVGVYEGVITRASGGLARSFLECKTGLDARVEVLKFNVRGLKPDRVGDDGVAPKCFKGLGLEGTAIGGIAGTGGMWLSSSSSLARCFFGFLRKKAIARDFPLLDFPCDLLDDAER